MEQYNLNNDALAYSQAVQDYNAGLIQRAQDQAKLNQEAKDRDDAVNEPLSFITEAAMGKPIKNIISKAKQAGVKWVKGKVKDQISKLGSNEEGTSLEDVINGEQPLLPENTPEAIRQGVNKLRQALGKRPIQPRGEDPAPRGEIQETNIDEAAKDFTDTSAPEYSDFPADSAVRNPPKINLKGIKTKAQAREVRSNLENRYRNMDENTQADIQDKFLEDPSTVENPQTAEDLIQNIRNTQKYIRQAEQNPDTRFKSETPEQSPQDAPSGTDLKTAGDNPASEGADTAEGTEAVEGAEAGTEGAELGGAAAFEEGAGAAAAAEGGLNPIADLLALGGLVGALFGIGAHHSKPVSSTITPINPSIQHGI